jgi:hypothetical protein
MSSTGFELATPATNRLQTYALDRAATEVGTLSFYGTKNVVHLSSDVVILSRFTRSSVLMDTTPSLSG